MMTHALTAHPIQRFKGNNIGIFSLIIGSVIVFFATTAQAETFVYSYTFEGGVVVSGSFDGTADGNLVSSLSNITVSVDGIVFDGFLFGSSLSQNTHNYESGGATASFNGLQNNFAFFDTDYYSAYPDMSFTFKFASLAYNSDISEIVSTNIASLYQTAPFVQIDETGTNSPSYSAARWSLTPVSAVPEPSTYALMLAGLAAVAFAAKRRRVTAAQLPA